jgi:sugar lactone lactonase YvrE
MLNDIFRSAGIRSSFPLLLPLLAFFWFSLSIEAHAQALDRLHYGQDRNAAIDPGLSISGPIELLCDFEGNLFLLSRDDNKVLKFSPEGELLAEIGGYGFGVRQFNHPNALASPDGGLNLFVLDSENRRIVRLSNSLKWIDQFPIGPDQSGRIIEEPSGLAVNSPGEIFISDPHNQRIVKFDEGGKYLGELTGKGIPVLPGMLAMDARDYLYACGIDGDVVLVFDDMGNLERRITPDSVMSMDRIMVAESYIYILDFESQRVYIYTMNFRLTARLLLFDQVSGEKTGPVAMALGPSHWLWIADLSQNRILGYVPIWK